MYGINTPNAMRMLAMLHQANQPAPEPPAPIRKTVSRPKSAPAPRSRRPPTPQTESESESEFSDSGSSASSGSYEDVDTIYHHVVEEKKCPNISPAGLKSKSSSSKDAVAYLKSKNCPEVPSLKKPKTAPPPAPAPASPKAPTKAEAPKPKKSKSVKIAEAAPVEAAPAPAPSAPAAVSTEKKKRAPSAYNTFVAEQRKAGKTMKEAAEAWKAKKGS